MKTVTKAELQEQLQSSEKLMQSLNETWEEKLTRTQEVHKEREKALEELGITVEKSGIGVHTPKKVRTIERHESVDNMADGRVSLDAASGQFGMYGICQASLLKSSDGSLWTLRTKVRLSRF